MRCAGHEGPNINFLKNPVSESRNGHRCALRKASSEPEDMNLHRFMANKSSKHAEGLLTGDFLKTFYSITGDYPNFQYVPGQESFPNNWCKRNPVDVIPFPTSQKMRSRWLYSTQNSSALTVTRESPTLSPVSILKSLLAAFTLLPSICRATRLFDVASNLL